MNRRTGKPPVLPHVEEAILPNGKRLTPGREFSVAGGGRYRFRYLYVPDGSLAAFGPIEGRGSKSPRLRAIRPEDVRTVHHSATEVRP